MGKTYKWGSLARSIHFLSNCADNMKVLLFGATGYVGGEHNAEK